MSETSQGPGWWLATDGRWYPPPKGIGLFAPADTPIPVDESSPTPSPSSEPNPSDTTEPAPAPVSGRRRWKLPALIAGPVILALLAVGTAYLATRHSSPFANGTPSGQGFLCTLDGSHVSFVTWSTATDHVTGTYWVSRTTRTAVIGTQVGNTIRIQPAEKSRRTGHFLKMTLSADSLTLTIPFSGAQPHCTLASRTRALPKLQGFTPTTTSEKTGAPQSNLTNADVTARTIYTKTGSYPAMPTLLTAMTAQTPAIKYTSGPAAKGADSVSLTVGGTPAEPNRTVIILTAAGADTACWVLADNESSTSTTAVPGHSIPIGSSYAWEKTPAVDCSASAAEAAIPSTAWKPTFKTAHSTTT